MTNSLMGRWNPCKSTTYSMTNEVSLVRAGLLYPFSHIPTYRIVVYNSIVQDQTVGRSTYREIVLSFQFETHIDRSLFERLVLFRAIDYDECSMREEVFLRQHRSRILAIIRILKVGVHLVQHGVLVAIHIEIHVAVRIALQVQEEFHVGDVAVIETAGVCSVDWSAIRLEGQDDETWFLQLIGRFDSPNMLCRIWKHRILVQFPGAKTHGDILFDIVEHVYVAFIRQCHVRYQPLDSRKFNLEILKVSIRERCLHHCIRIASWSRKNEFVFRVDDDFSVVFGKTENDREWYAYIEVSFVICQLFSLRDIEPSSVFNYWTLTRTQWRIALYETRQTLFRLSLSRRSRSGFPQIDEG